MFVALTFLVHFISLPSGLFDMLGLLVYIRFDDAQVGPFYYHPVGFVFVDPLACKEICHLLFAVDNLTGIKLVV